MGSHGPAVPVDVTIGVPRKPTFWEKIGLAKQDPYKQVISIYVCCEECAAKVRSDPNQTDYLVKVITERGGLLK